MNADAKAQLVEMLQAVADKLRDRPRELEAEYDSLERSDKLPRMSRAPRELGALQSLCEISAIEINALIETFLKPQRRRRT